MKFKYIFIYLFLLSARFSYANNNEIIYVNNITGNDIYNGKSATYTGSSGPVKTIQKALDLVATSGKVEIANTGTPYLSGNRVKKGGTANFPLIIEGNGAVISGLGIVSENEWINVEDNIYRRPFWPMSNQLKTSKEYKYWIGIPEIWRINGLAAKNCTSKDDLKNSPYGFWWNKEEQTVWFNLPKDKKLSELKIELPIQRGHGSGINVNGALSHIIIRNLQSEFAFNDGFSAHGSVNNLIFKNCIAINNCGQGFSMHDKTQVLIEDSFASRNASSGTCDVASAEVTYRRSVFVNNSFEAGIYATENVKATYEDCMIVNNMPFEQIWQRGKSQINLKNCLIIGASPTISLASIENGSIKFENCTFGNGLNITSFKNKISGNLLVKNSLVSNLKEVIDTSNKFRVSIDKSYIDVVNHSFPESELSTIKTSKKNGFPYHKKVGAQLPEAVWKLYKAYVK